MKNFTSLLLRGTVLTAASLCMFTMGSCRGKDNDKRGGAPTIDVAVAETDSVVLHKDYPGVTFANSKVDVVGRVNGTLLTCNFTPGDYVRKGQVLYTIEDTKYRDAVTQAQAALTTAESQLDYARRRCEAMKKALLSDAVSQMDVTQAEANVRQAEASVNNARAALSTARTNLGYCVVQAPISGYIDASTIDPGGYVGGEGAPVTLNTIIDDSKLGVKFSIEDSQYEKLVGSNGGVSNALYRQVPIKFSAELPHQYTTDLYYESPDVKTSTGTIVLKGKLHNDYNEIKDGMYVTISLPYGENPKAILVKDASIGTDQLGKYLYVVNDSDKVVYTPVKVGELVRDSLRIVDSGLKPGDRYVTRALLTVRNGMQVKPKVVK